MQGMTSLYWLIEFADINSRIDRQPHKMHVRIFLVQSLEVGHFVNTRGTPGRPKVNDDRLANPLVHGLLDTISVWKRLIEQIGACVRHQRQRRSHPRGREQSETLQKLTAH